MQKRTRPHYPIPTVVDLLAKGDYRVTRTAMEGASRLGLDLDDIVQIVSGLTIKNFYKSMTTYADNSIWQDVYHVDNAAGEIYLKITVCDHLLVVSFKER